MWSCGSDAAEYVLMGDSFTHIDLFSGIGGFHAAIDSALRDRRETSEGAHAALAEIVDVPRRADLLTAGFPCQAHSAAAHGNNTAPCLWPETLQIIRHLRPVWVLLENVPGYRLPHIERACSDLENIDYAVWPVDLGVEIRKSVRRRIYVVAHANENGEPQCPVDAETSSIQKAAIRWRGESEPLGVDDGLPGKMDRMRALGDSIRVYEAEMIIRAIVSTEPAA